MKRLSGGAVAIVMAAGLGGCIPPPINPPEDIPQAPVEAPTPTPTPTPPPVQQVTPQADKLPPPGKVQAVKPSLFDTDENGLYDDTERKAVLDAIQKEAPELTETFDADGDGKVSIAEMSAGRHPLQFLVPKRIIDSRAKIPWTLDIFPEWLSTAYFQEDTATGEVAEHTPRGTIPAKASQVTTTLQPRKNTERGGVEFAANTGQFLTMPGQRDARWNYRWCLFTFRIDANSGTGNETVLLDLNQGEGSNKSSPKVWYNKETGLSIQYVGLNKDGLDKRVMTTKNVVADGKTWNVVVCGIRYGQMFASVNGTPLATETKQPPRFSGEWPRDSASFLGDSGNSGNMAWAYDSLVFGLTEPSEAMVQKMTGWAAHRLGLQANLPENHPYKNERPILDAEDFPARYVHNDEEWNTWGAKAKANKEDRARAGGPRKESKGYERVFFDDFRASRVKASSSGESDLWAGPGFNIAVGASAPLVTPGNEPEVYPYDAVNKNQILSLAKEGDRWWGSAFYSVNDLGHGYTWAGPKIFRIRCMFPKIAPKDLPGGLFPAFWSYAPDSLFWRTANRIEVDWFEFDGKNGSWYNGLSYHYHYPYVKNIFAKKAESYKSYKGFGGELTADKTKIPKGLYFWDGEFHTWEFVVDRDKTYVNVTLPSGKQDRWVQIYEGPTAPTALERLDLQLDYALKSKNGDPKERQDFVVDWIEVLQKAEDVEKVPVPFTSRPQLTGSSKPGSTLTCQPNAGNITDVRYYWFADGYPLTYGPENTYTVTAAEAGKPIRCMVKAVGALDMPEAWSNIVK